MNSCPVQFAFPAETHLIPVQFKSSGVVSIKVEAGAPLTVIEKRVVPIWVPIPVTDELAEYQ